MATTRGIGVIWGVGTSTISEFGTCKIQSRDYSRKGEKVQIKDENGNTVGLSYFDYIEKATWRYIPNSANSGSAVSFTPPAFGDSFTVADTTLTWLAGSSPWFVEDVNVKSTNDNATGCDVEAWRYAGITS